MRFRLHGKYAATETQLLQHVQAYLNWLEWIAVAVKLQQSGLYQPAWINVYLTGEACVIPASLLLVPKLTRFQLAHEACLYEVQSDCSVDTLQIHLSTSENVAYSAYRNTETATMEPVPLLPPLLS